MLSAEQKLKCLRGYMKIWVRDWPESKRYSFDRFLDKAQKDYVAKHELRCKKHCVYCERGFAQNVRMTQDHVIPISLGGVDEYENILAACYNCNQWKGNKELRHWIRDLHLMKRLKMQGSYYSQKHIRLMIKNVEKIIDTLGVKPVYFIKNNASQLAKAKNPTYF